MSHGYPATSYLQMGIVYLCGLHTARQQGIVKNNEFFRRYWRHHYFDWITFAKRSTKYGLVGGLIAGTMLFGNPDLAMRRAFSKYQYWFVMKPLDCRDNQHNWFVKFNN